MINFKDFSKEEIIIAAETILQYSMLPSLEEYIIKMLNTSKLNRLTQHRNTIAKEINSLLEQRQNKQRDFDILKLNKAFEKSERDREKQLKELFKLGIITKDEHIKLSIPKRDKE